jgi:hypothetical protein
MQLSSAFVGFVLTSAIVCGLSGCATVKDLDDLSAMQISALQESSGRLDVYDQRLMELDKLLAQGKIRAASYHRQANQLTSLIADECQFQNAVLIKDPKIKVMAQHLLDNIQKALQASPVIVAKIAIGVLEGLAGSHGTITP